MASSTLALAPAWTSTNLPRSNTSWTVFANVPLRSYLDTWCLACSIPYGACLSRWLETYVGHHVYRIPSSVSLHRLQHAWDSFVAVNPVLRTRTVQSTTHGAVQVVLKHKSATMRHVEGRENEREYYLAIGYGDALWRCMANEAIASGQVTFVLIMHHALYDGWSPPLLLEQLHHAYNRGEAAEPEGSFANFLRFLQSTPSASSSL